MAVVAYKPRGDGQEGAKYSHSLTEISLSAWSCMTYKDNTQWRKVEKEGPVYPVRMLENFD